MISRSLHEQVQKQAAKAWSLWEGATSKLYTDSGFLEKFEDDEFSLAFARIECHFFSNTVSSSMTLALFGEYGTAYLNVFPSGLL